MGKYNKYINLPFSNLGRDFNGCDCYGLFYLIYKEERNIILPDFTEVKYSLEWFKEEKNHIIEHIWEAWIKVDEPYKEYDGLIFYSSKHIASHIGLWIGEGDKFIHINDKQPARVNKLNRAYKSRLYGVMRFNG